MTRTREYKPRRSCDRWAAALGNEARYSVEFRADEQCLRWLAFPSPPDRRARLEAYGLSEPAGLVDRVIAGQRDRMEQVGRLAAAGRQPQANWVANGYLQELARRVGVSERLARALG